MRDLSTLLPTGMRFRELWLPAHSNNNATLQSCVNGGRALTQTGAQGRTTADGVHFPSGATSQIDCGPIHNNIPKLWVSARFRLNASYAAGTPNLWLFDLGNMIPNNQLLVTLDQATGKLVWAMTTGGVARFTLSSTQTTWAANTWYHFLVSLSDTAGGIQRLIIDGGVAVTDVQAAVNTPNAGSLRLGARSDMAVGLVGEIADVTIGTDDLTAAEEANLAKGIPPSDAVNRYLLDEGMGLTAYDRGSGANNGTLGTGCTWAFGGCKRPVLSFDGINDYATIPVDITGDCTIVWAGKLKSSYDSATATKRLLMVYLDANNRAGFFSDSTPRPISFFTKAAGGADNFITYTGAMSIDDYVVLAGVITAGTGRALYRNGVLVGSSATADLMAPGAYQIFVGIDFDLVAAQYDVSKPLLVGILDGAMTADQVRTFSRALDQRLGMGIGI